MIPARVPADDADRVAVLRALQILDTEPEERFDRITRLAQRLFDAPIALMTLVDEHRQWFKSRQGLALPETSRDASFCAHAILDDDVMVVTDATADPRFAGNPLVTGDPGIRFYAGCPIEGPNGARLGTLCVIDRSPRDLSDADAQVLRDLAAMVEKEIAALHLALSDDMTGLSNRRGFMLQAGKLLEVCKRKTLPATLLYLDIDEFKSINDRFGHDEGDRAIQTAARLLQESLRASDVVARLGGDEFVALLTGTAGDDAPAAMARLDELAGEQRTGYTLSFSVGTAAFDPEDPIDVATLLERADEAMYKDKRAKREGKS